VELNRSGFKTVCVAARDFEEVKISGFAGEIVPVERIEKAMDVFNV